MVKVLCSGPGVGIIISSMVLGVKLFFSQFAIRIIYLTIITAAINHIIWDSSMMLDLILLITSSKPMNFITLLTHDVLRIHRETKEIVLNGHLQVLDFHDTSDLLRHLKNIDAFNLIVVDPSCDELERPIKVVNHMLISIDGLKVLNDRRLNMG